MNPPDNLTATVSSNNPFFWSGGGEPQPLTRASLDAALRDYYLPVVILEHAGQLFLSNEMELSTNESPWKTIAFSQPFAPESLGDPAFLKSFGLRYPLYAGAMANGISSVELVEAMGRAGCMGSFGAGGVPHRIVEEAITKLRAGLDGKPCAFNLLNSPFEPALEDETVALYLKHGVRLIEASAYLSITKNLALYRAAGLSARADGGIEIANRIIAKVSRKEIAARFMEPAPQDALNQLAQEGKIGPEQAELARRVPVADAVTVEADSGGHTDNRPLVGVLPAVIRLRDQIQTKHGYARPVFVGAGGGIATPESALAAFMMGAAYVVTGSVNQACLESGASAHTKKLLAQAEMTDVAMAPAADMFEMGVKVQVLKRGTMFAMRAQKLYELYSRCDSMEAIPPAEREKLESGVFKMPLDAVWEECRRFFSERDPKQIERAEADPKAKMALVFRWYLGLSSRWSSRGEPGREMDYQIWCGPAMGAFNDWVRGSPLEAPENRRAAEVSLHILRGAAYLFRLKTLESQGVRFVDDVRQYVPD